MFPCLGYNFNHKSHAQTVINYNTVRCTVFFSGISSVPEHNNFGGSE